MEILCSHQSGRIQLLFSTRERQESEDIRAVVSSDALAQTQTRTHRLVELQGRPRHAADVEDKLEVVIG